MYFLIMEWIKKYWWGLLIILIIPIVINYILLLPAITPIVGDNTVWLSFWGGYLGAIISAAVAFVILAVQYRQNQNENIASRQLQINTLKYQQELNQLHCIINISAKLISCTNPYKIIDVCNKIGRTDIDVIELFETLSLNIENCKSELEIYIKTDPKILNHKFALDIDGSVFNIKTILMDIENIVAIFDAHHGNLDTSCLANEKLLYEYLREQTLCIITQYKNSSKETLDYMDCRSITSTMVKEILEQQYNMQNNILDYIKQEQSRIDKILTGDLSQHDRV